MSACTDSDLLVAALVDGELDARNTALGDAHARRCPHCREQLGRLERLRGLLCAKGVRHRAPDHVAARIATMPELRNPNPNARLLASWLVPAAAGAMAASLALAILNPAANETTMTQQLVSSHVHSLQPGHLVDVETGNRTVVKPWFDGRIDFAPPVPELGEAGFPLAGGRLDSVEGKSIAAIVFHRRLHTVNLFVWKGGGEVSGMEALGGFAITKWSKGGLRFAAVSDIPPEELERFKSLYRRQPG